MAAASVGSGIKRRRECMKEQWRGASAGRGRDGVVYAIRRLAIGIPLSSIGLAILAIVGLLWWAGARLLSPFAQVREVLIALTGAGLVFAEAYRGKQYQTWTPAASIRQTSDSKR